MSLKYINNNGEEVIIAGRGLSGKDGNDGVPTGVILQYQGDEIPEGFEEVEISGLNQPIVLYENLNGTQESTITLTNSLANYEFIDIEFKTTRIADGLAYNYFFTERVYNPNGKYMQGHIHCTGNNDKIHDMIKELYFNKNIITVTANYYELRAGNNFSVRNTSDYLAITKIVGSPMQATEGSLINFSIWDISYQAEEGMTFEEWVNSEYNVDGWEIYTPSSGYITNSDIIDGRTLYVYAANGVEGYATNTDIIVPDYAYSCYQEK